MTVEKALELLDKAWTESLSRLGGAPDEREKTADFPCTTDGDSNPLDRALESLDQAWDASQVWFDRDEQLKRLKALFPLYLLEQIHRSRPLSFDEWKAWTDQVRSDLVNPDELTVSAGNVDGPRAEVGRLIKEFLAESEKITPRLFAQEGASNVDC